MRKSTPRAERDASALERAPRVVQRQRGLPPGQRVLVRVDPPVQGEIHEVLPDGSYRVRITHGDPRRAGEIVVFPESDVVADVGRWDVPDILASQLVNRYLGNRERGRLAQVNSRLRESYSSVAAYLQVSPGVQSLIGQNVGQGDPPMRPDQGKATVTWATTEGNPHAGISEDKTEPVYLRVFGLHPPLEVITSGQLEELYKAEALGVVRRMYVAKHGARPASAADLTPAERDRINQARLETGGKTLDDENPVSEAELERIATVRRDEAERAAAELRYEQQPKKWRKRHEDPKKPDPFVETKMWDRVGQEAAKSPRQAIFVDLVNTRFSRYRDINYRDVRFQGKYRDGRFVLVASRGAMALARELAPSVPPPPIADLLPADKPPTQAQIVQLHTELRRRIRSMLDSRQRPEEIEKQLVAAGIPEALAVDVIMAVLEERGTPGAANPDANV